MGLDDLDVLLEVVTLRDNVVAAIVELVVFALSIKGGPDSYFLFESAEGT